MKKHLIVAAGAALMASACNSGKDHAADQPSSQKDVLIEHMDSTVRPQDDFFDYANGGWIKNNPIPAEESSWGIGKMVQEDIYKKLISTNEKAMKASAAEGSTDQKIGDFWFSAMDTTKIEQAGLAPLQPTLDKLNSIADLNSLMTFALDLQRKGVGSFFGSFVAQDAKRSDVMALYLYQGGLGLPNRDYYFNNDERTKGIREKYVLHIANMLKLAGTDTAAAKTQAQTIMQLETELAKNSRKLEDLRDPYKNYNKMATAGLGKMTAEIDWSSAMATLGAKTDSVIVGQPEFYTALGKMLKTQPLDSWKTYLRWHILHSYAGELSNSFVNENFDFYGKALSGAEKMRPRWKRMLDTQEEAMGELLGQLFVKEFFPEKTKKRYSDMVEAVRGAYKIRIEQLDWMSDSTKQKALYKLSKISKKVGYPDKWKDFSSLKIGRTSLVENMMNSNEYWHQYSFNKLGKPVDRNEWDMTPQTYNAYYNPSNNEIVLPAGIFMVPGAQDDLLDDALVYGYAGASTIGHEITHGFDDEGRQFDAEGNLKEWWTPADAANFKKRADVMVQQFNGYMPVDTQRINGKATLGENIADLGGILIGYDAFKQTAQFKENKIINGLNPSQRFFLGYALGWLYNIRKEKLAQQLMTDVHSPAKYRVNGPFSDVDAFYEAFKVTEQDKMFIKPENRVRIW